MNNQYFHLVFEINILKQNVKIKNKFFNIGRLLLNNYLLSTAVLLIADNNAKFATMIC